MGLVSSLGPGSLIGDIPTLGNAAGTAGAHTVIANGPFINSVLSSLGAGPHIIPVHSPAAPKPITIPSSLGGAKFLHPTVAAAVARHASNSARPSAHTPNHTSHFIAPHVAASSTVHSPTPAASTPRVPGTSRLGTIAANKAARAAAAASTPAGPDLVQQQVAGQQQLADRLGQWYDSQLATAHSTAGADSTAAQNQIQSLISGLPAATTLNPNMTANAQAIAQPALTDQNQAQSAANLGPLQVAQAQIASQGSSLQQRMLGLTAANDQSTIEQKNQDLANEPAMEATAATNAADLALKQDSAQALQNTYNLDAQKAVNQNTQAVNALGEKTTNDNATQKNAANATALKAITDQVAQSNAQSKLNATQTSAISKYIDSHFYAKNPTTGVTGFVPGMNYNDALSYIASTYGPQVGVQTVLGNTDLVKTVRQGGPDSFYKDLLSHGIAAKQAANYLVQAGFSQAQATNMRRYGNSGSTLADRVSNQISVAAAAQRRAKK